LRPLRRLKIPAGTVAAPVSPARARRPLVMIPERKRLMAANNSSSMKISAALRFV